MADRFRAATCAGRSMEPAIPAGTPVVVDTWWESMRAGDVVCFTDAVDGTWTLHRVLARFRLGPIRFLVQAPESAGAAGILPEDRVVGIVRGAIVDYRRPVRARERWLAARTILRYLARRALRGRGGP